MARVYDRFLRQRLSRRRLLAGTGGVAVGAAVLAACGDTGGGGTTTTGSPEVDEGEVTKDGILRLAHSQVLPSLNVFGATALGPAGVFGPSVFDHLWIVPLDTQDVVNLLADTIENPDDQGLEIICTLKESVFHNKPPVNGRPVVAQDVKASWEAFAADMLAPGHDWYHNHFQSIDAPDTHTVVIKQKAPYAWVFHPSGAGSTAWSSILPEETLDPDIFNLDQDLIGSGRLMMTSFGGGEDITLSRHPEWRVEGEPFLAGTNSKLVTEPVAAQAAFRAAEIDTAGAGAIANRVDADTMQAVDPERVIVTRTPQRSYATLQLKMVEPFDDIRVRKAIRLALNRIDIAKGVSLDPEGGRPAGPVPPAQEIYALPEEETADYYRFDQEEAKSLLEQASFPFDKTFVLKYWNSDTQQNQAQLIKEQLGDVGINVNLVGEDLLTVWLPKSLPQGDFDMTAYGQLSYDDPAIPLSFFTKESALGNAEDPRGRNNMDFFDDEITAAVNAVNSELNEEERIEKVKDAVRIIIQKEAPMINLYSSFSYSARWHWYKGLVTGRGVFNSFNGRSWIDTRLRGS